MSAPAPTPETIILIDDEYVYAAIVNAMKAEKPSVWAKFKSQFLGGQSRVASISQARQRISVAEIEPNGSGFTSSRRFRINGAIINVLLIKPADGQLFGMLTLAELHQRVGIERVLCIARAVTLREDLHTGDVALVTQASALPYPALYESRPPQWQKNEEESSREPEHYFLSNDSLKLGRAIASTAVDAMRQNYIPEVHTGYARHPAWGGGMSPWANEQFKSLTANGLETLSEIPVGVYDFATRTPEVPVICFNIIAGRAQERAAGDLARDGDKDPTRYAFYAGQNLESAVRLVAEFLRK